MPIYIKNENKVEYFGENSSLGGYKKSLNMLLILNNIEKGAII